MGWYMTLNNRVLIHQIGIRPVLDSPLHFNAEFLPGLGMGKRIHHKWVKNRVFHLVLQLFIKWALWSIYSIGLTTTISGSFGDFNLIWWFFINY